MSTIRRPRDGLEIDRATMVYALQQGFALTYIHAWFITTSGYLITGQWKHMSLFDLCRHDGIEHNASLAHADTVAGEEYAPEAFESALVSELAEHSTDGGHTLNIRGVAQARVLREEESMIDVLHAEIARGEVGLVLDIFGGRRRRVDLTQLREWFKYERFPEGWCPSRQQSLVRTMLTSQMIKQNMIALRANGPDVEPEWTWVNSLCQTYLYFFERWAQKCGC
jgi:hypothetical protein